MNPARLSSMPDWPARMTADVACLYMGQSKGTFLTRFGYLGRSEGRNVYWARAQLDRHIANQFDLPQPSRIDSEVRDTSWDDLR